MSWRDENASDIEEAADPAPTRCGAGATVARLLAA